MLRPLGQLEGWCLAPGCCLLIPTTRRSRHNRCWRPIGPHKPGLSSHSEHPFTSSSHLPDFHQSLVSNFSVLLSFLFLSPPIYQISPVVSNLILNLAFVIFKTSSFFPRPTDLSLPFFPISHFPSSSHLQNQNTSIFSFCRDISPFLDNLMVSTMNTIYCLNAIHLG